MSIAKSERSFFDPEVRSRGEEYFRNGYVRIVKENASETLADVRSSQGGFYVVEILWDDEGDVELTECNCPYAIAEGDCKHIWATFLELDRRRSQKKTKKSRGSKSTTKKSSQPAWLKSLESSTSAARNNTVFEEGTVPAAGPAFASTDEFWYVINVSGSHSKDTLMLDFRIQQERATGLPGAIKELKISRDNLSSIAHPEHKAILQECLDCIEGIPGPMQRYDYGWMRPQSWSSMNLRPLLQPVILPKIAKTGRLFWRLDTGVSIDEARQITWDDGAPWDVNLLFQEQTETQEWVVTASLIRNRDSADNGAQLQTRPLSDVVWLNSTGVVLFPDCIATIDLHKKEAWVRMLLQTSELRIPFADREQFLKKLVEIPHLAAIDLPERLTNMPATVSLTPRIRLLSPEKVPHRMRHMKFVFGVVEFVYPETVVSIRDRRPLIWNEEKSCPLKRDIETETGYLQQLSELGVKPLAQDFGFEEIDIKVPDVSMPSVVRQLIDSEWIVEAEGVKLRRPGNFSIGVTSGIDWFELQAHIDFDGTSASLPDLLQAIRKGENFVRLSDGTRGMLPEEWLNRYGRIASIGEVSGDAIRFKPSQAMILDALLDAQQSVVRDRDFANFCRRLKKFSGIKPQNAPKTFHGDLREYQKQGLGWLTFLNEFHLGGCLADDMGLGKTIQVLAFLESRRTRKLPADTARKPTLVIVPKSLVFNWIEESAKFVPKLSVLDYTGLDRKQRLTNASSCDVIVTTYGTARNDILELQEMEFDYVILDEAQAIKNPDSLSAKACRLLKSNQRLAMTGTPIENHLGELWSLFEFLNPGMLGSSAMFQRLTAPNDNAEDREIALKTLSRALQPFLLRRTKSQVLTELPGKTEQTITCEMPPKQQKLYNELRDYYRLQLSAKVEELGINKAKIHVLEALLRLRQAACHPGLIDPKRSSENSAKVDTILAQLKQLADEGHKALVFSQFTTLLSILKQRLDNEGIRYEYLDGKTRKRQERVESFQNDDKCPLFLISLKAGGHGLNLTAADYVFILDPWWNPAVEAQAVDRAHRMGQDRHVFAYRLICKDTVEERILQMQKEKKQLADAIVSADASLISTLTADDLQLLLT